MKCVLMHKNTAVAELFLNDSKGFIGKIYQVCHPEHLPVGVSVRKGTVNREELNEWWINHSIPASRSGIREALEKLNLSDTAVLLMKCFGLSLSDQYWICPEGSDLSWDKINFFDHPFSDDIGDVLFGISKKEKNFDFSSPDNTAEGNLQKRWKIIDGKRCLIKAGSSPFRQQPFNEVIACRIMQLLGIPHVRYDVIWDDGYPYSVCEDFVSADTELISAWRIMMTEKRDNSTSVYAHFVKCCKALGVCDVVHHLDQMIVIDYIIANEDRHLNNFGLIRNADTLEWIGFSPIFDSGSSLGFDKVPYEIMSGKDITCKPFKKHHEQQLNLVSSFEWIDFDRLEDVEDMIRDVLGDERNRRFIDESRIDAVVNSVSGRIRKLKEIAMTHPSGNAAVSTEDDVTQNTAAVYR